MFDFSFFLHLHKLEVSPKAFRKLFRILKGPGFWKGTIHLRRRQIFTLFWPLPPYHLQFFYPMVPKNKTIMWSHHIERSMAQSGQAWSWSHLTSYCSKIWIGCMKNNLIWDATLNNSNCTYLSWYGTIHLRRRQIFTLFWPLPPTVGKFGKFLTPPPPRACRRLKWMVPKAN